MKTVFEKMLCNFKKLILMVPIAISCTHKIGDGANTSFCYDLHYTLIWKQ